MRKGRDDANQGISFPGSFSPSFLSRFNFAYSISPDAAAHGLRLAGLHLIETWIVYRFETQGKRNITKTLTVYRSHRIIELNSIAGIRLETGIDQDLHPHAHREIFEDRSGIGTGTKTDRSFKGSLIDRRIGHDHHLPVGLHEKLTFAFARDAIHDQRAVRGKCKGKRFR